MITHKHPEYTELRKKTGQGKYNGCWYYAQEILDNIIPNVNTWRDWNTVGRELTGMCDHMIVFLHDNSTPWHYDWLKKYKDLVLVCSSKYTMQSVCYSGNTVLLPMSVDVEYVEKFKTKKTKDTCYVGNKWVMDSAEENGWHPECQVDYLSSMPREELLTELAKYRRAICIDRCAIEAAVLGCEVIIPDTGYSVDNIGRVLDNRDAAQILQTELDKLDIKGGIYGSKNGDE